MKLILVTGQHKSGTAAVAQVLQRLGVPMALWLNPPFPPMDQFDWECADALANLTENLSAYGTPPNEEGYLFFAHWFSRYLERRLVHASDLRAKFEIAVDCIGVKSPLFAFFVPQMLAVCKDMGIDLRIIKCERTEKARQQSLKRTHSLIGTHESALLMQQAIADAVFVMPKHMTVQLEELRDKPLSMVKKLAKLADLEDSQKMRNRINSAAIMVRPKSKPVSVWAECSEIEPNQEVS